VNAQLTLIAYCLGYVAVFTALGSGPALSLGRSLLPTPPVMLAPCIGVALAGAGLIAMWPWMTMETAAWAVLLPACVGSLAWAIRLARRYGLGDLRDSVIPGSFAALGVLVSILPALLRATVGPTTLFVYDAMGYIPIDQWMRDAHEGTRITPFQLHWNLSASHGYDASQHGVRAGVSAINGSVSALFGSSPDQTHLAFMAVLLGLVPVSIWIVARGIGIGQVGASVGAAFGLSPSLFSMVGDSTLANLAASVLVAPLLLIGGLAIARGGIRACCVTGILIGGLVSIYPEFLTPTIGVAGVAGLMLAVVRVREGSFTRAWLWVIVMRCALITAAVVVVWWVPVRRAELYLSRLTSPDQPAFAGLPPRWLSFDDVGAWAFGVLHLYQLQRFALLSTPREALAVVLPVLLALLVLWGSSRLGLWSAVLLLAPVGVSIPLALVAYGRYQDGRCEYCEWKTLTFTLSFLAIGVAAGSDRVWRSIRNRRDRWRLATIVVGVIPLAGVAALAYADERLAQAMYESPAILSTDLREVAGSLGTLSTPRRVLIDAPDADAGSPLQLPATYFLLRQSTDAYISFDASGIAPAYLYPLYLPIRDYYSSTYRYVLTPFAGMATGRRILAQHGNFALERRRPVDVTLARTGWTLDTTQGAGAIPWVQTPFRLWIASPKAQPISLRISLERPLGDHATLTFATEDGRGLRVVPNQTGSSLCIPLRVAAGATAITVSPHFDKPPQPAIRVTESDPLPSPPRAIGLAALQTDTVRCPVVLGRNIPPDVTYGTGWFAPETDAAGTFRWMGTTATIDVGDVGIKHGPVTLRSTVASLMVPRSITVTIAGRVVQTIEALPDSGKPFTIRVPAGNGSVHIVLRADPRAGSASQVTPADHRMLAVRLRVPEIVPS
jgi:hypothetical protein